MSLFWCGVQAVILAYKDIIFFGMAATQWSLLGFQGWWNTSVQVYSLLAPTSSSSVKCAVDQKSHKHANIAPLLSSQSLYTANAQQQAPLTVPFIFSWYTVKLLRPLLIISWIWGSTIFSKETVHYSISEPLNIFTAFSFFTPIFLTYWNASDLHEQYKKFLCTTPTNYGFNFFTSTVSDLNSIRFSIITHPTLAALWFKKLITENQPLILSICHANPIKQSLPRSQKHHSSENTKI